MKQKTSCQIVLLLLAAVAGCAGPSAVSTPVREEPLLPSGRLSPDRQWTLIQENTTNPPGRRLLVAPAADADRSRIALSGLPGPRYLTIWSSPPAPPLLVITDPLIHRGSKCFVYDPVADRLWRIDEDANRDMDLSVPAPLERRQTRARAISPDASHVLIDISGSIRNSPFYKVYAVETGTGKIARTFRHEYLVPEEWWR